MNLTINPEHDGMPIKVYLREVHGFSRRGMRKMVHTRETFFVNGFACEGSEILNAGDKLQIIFPAESRSTNVKCEEIQLDMFYEDDAVMVVNKPYGMAVTPSMNQKSGTLANGLAGYYERNGLVSAIHIVTRLDKDTSGLVLIAKHQHAHMVLARALQQSLLKRSYMAVLEGKPSRQSGNLTGRIGRKEGSIIERIVRSDGQRAVTHYQLIYARGSHALANVQLETGRTHQIRVHFAHAGYPLAGDSLYGGAETLISRQALHCYYLGFEHPLTQKHLAFTSEPPRDFRRLLM